MLNGAHRTLSATCRKALCVPGTICAVLNLVVHRYILMRLLAVESHSAAGFYSFSLSLWDDLGDSVFDGGGLAGFKSRANALLFA